MAELGQAAREGFTRLGERAVGGGCRGFLLLPCGTRRPPRTLPSLRGEQEALTSCQAAPRFTALLGEVQRFPEPRRGRLPIPGC